MGRPLPKTFSGFTRGLCSRRNGLGSGESTDDEGSIDSAVVRSRRAETLLKLEGRGHQPEKGEQLSAAAEATTPTMAAPPTPKGEGEEDQFIAQAIAKNCTIYTSDQGSTYRMLNKENVPVGPKRITRGWAHYDFPTTYEEGGILPGVSVIPAINNEEQKRMFTDNLLAHGPTVDIMYAFNTVMKNHTMHLNREIHSYHIQDVNGNWIDFPEDDETWPLTWEECKKLVIVHGPIHEDITDEQVLAGDARLNKGLPVPRHGRAATSRYTRKSSKANIKVKRSPSSSVTSQTMDFSGNDLSIEDTSAKKSKKPRKRKKKPNNSNLSTVTMVDEDSNMGELVASNYSDSQNTMVASNDSDLTSLRTFSSESNLLSVTMVSKSLDFIDDHFVSNESNMQLPSKTLTDSRLSTLNIASNGLDLERAPVAPVESSLGVSTMASENLHMENSNLIDSFTNTLNLPSKKSKKKKKKPKKKAMQAVELLPKVSNEVKPTTGQKPNIILYGDQGSMIMYSDYGSTDLSIPGDRVGIDTAISEYFRHVIVKPLDLMDILDLPDQLPDGMLPAIVVFMKLWNLDWEI